MRTVIERKDDSDRWLEWEDGVLQGDTASLADLRDLRGFVSTGMPFPQVPSDRMGNHRNWCVCAVKALGGVGKVKGVEGKFTEPYKPPPGWEDAVV
ncbi:MAG: hypothetical protein ACR2NA_00770 [Solirubrobacterales bacterium]